MESQQKPVTTSNAVTKHVPSDDQRQKGYHIRASKESRLDFELFRNIQEDQSKEQKLFMTRIYIFVFDKSAIFITQMYYVELCVLKLKLTRKADAYCLQMT